MANVAETLRAMLRTLEAILADDAKYPQLRLPQMQQLRVERVVKQARSLVTGQEER